MSVLADQVRRLDAHLDSIIYATITSPQAQPTNEAAAQLNTVLHTPRVKDLLRIIKALSTTTGSQAVLPPSQLQLFLTQSSLLSDRPDEKLQLSQYESELEWLLVSKAAIQTYGVVVDMLLDQIVPLSDHIWYWDHVISSPLSTTIYMIQIGPARLGAWILEVYNDSRARLRRYTGGGANVEPGVAPAGAVASSLAPQWRRFYAIVKSTILEKSLADVQRRMMSPVALCRAEARRKQARLKRLREMTASGLGVLIDEGFAFSGIGADDGRSDSELSLPNSQEWKGVVERTVALMDMMLRDVLDLDLSTNQMEDKVFAAVAEDSLSVQVEEDDDQDRPVVVAKRLHALLDDRLSWNVTAARRLVAKNGKPSRLVRYWLPATALLLSSTTILRIFVNKRQAILEWVRDLGATIRGFWFNWVVEPARKVVGTIRHDANSEIAIMSRDSLKADRDSLERMVVDFALDKSTRGSAISETQVAEIRAKVREGDVTPILRAYEKDLRSPLMGTVRGDLVRTLLIQVQKTKVDVEVAMSGIDSLLRSQELVFGFVGLTPGIFVSAGVARYLLGVFGGRRGYAEKHKAGRCLRVLRNIDRVFSEAAPTQTTVLPYKDHGFLICEVHILRRLAHDLLPAEIEKDFLEDLNDLANLRGVQYQQRALDRIRWAYSKWLK
ncbi:putative ATP synthase regulation protein NCA2 [Rosellinia necatrix]|uniref:Putative ATP synthase regulation protein NCA2 n=1 Tax=Rosellinia necatrix TaxID=77044 RepID=A0A1W2TPM7_ROSNE|nr:putative ATP synthase regulation protein NCA2 [Rosellinia necatrix]